MKSREHIYDELLVLRCQEGDGLAFEELVDRWQERLWRHAWRLLGDEEASWDVLQESWLGISRGIQRLADPAAFRSWAYRIVSNKCGDWIRREQKRRSEDREYVEKCEEDRWERIAEGAKVASLREALLQLSGKDKAILSLRYEEAFDTGEIAAVLGIPAGTVKSRLYNAREKLKAIVEERRNE
jgi:RNA polymerase sigma-70 factor (ECF subfamily)